MKTSNGKLKRYLVAMFCVAGMLFSRGYAQDTTLLDHFQLMEVDDEVRITWVVSRGNTCNGMVIERSTDSLVFEEVGRYEGLCGNLDQPQRYDYVDAHPLFNQKSYYRLTTRGDVVSRTLSIEVLDLDASRYLVAPQPVVETSRLYFDNPRGELHFLTLTGPDGVTRKMLVSREERFEIGQAGLPPGFSLFAITSEAGVVVAKGKILVAR